jgi:hypothetical protein
MKKNSLLVCSLFFLLIGNAQVTETFESYTSSCQTFFTSGGITFNGTKLRVWLPNQPVPCTTSNSSGLGVGNTCTNDGCITTSNNFFDNGGNYATGQTYIIATGGTLFTLKSMYVYISTNGGTSPTSGSVTFVAKKAGNTQFSFTKTSWPNTTNGFSFVNFATEGGTNNSSTAIDAIEMTTAGNSINYYAVDNFRSAAVVTPTVTTSGTLTSFSAYTGSASAPQSFTVGGSGLSSSITITAPTGYEVTQTLSIGFSPTVTLAPISGTVANTTIYVRLKSTASGSPSGNIVCSATGATSQNIAVSSTANITCPATPLDQNFENYSDISYPASITLDCITYSTENAVTGNVGIGNTISQAISSGGALVGNVAILGAIGSNPVPLYGKFASTSTTINFKLVSLSAEFFGHSNGQVSEIYNIVGYDDGVQKVIVNNFSVTASGTYGTGAAAIVYNRLNYNVAGANTGTLTFGTGWSNIDEVRFVVNDPAPNNYLYVGLDNINFDTAVASTITTSGTTTAFAACSGTASAAQSFTVGGTGLSANITVTAPAGYEVSTTAASGYGATVTLTQSSGTVANTTVYVRLTASASGSPTGNVACTSAGTTTQNIAVSGTVSNIILTANSQTNIFCNGGSNGAASVNVATGGTAPYSYNWTPGNPTGDGTVSVTGLTAGTWTCTVTDANSCTKTQTFNITQPTALIASALSQTNILCNGGANGAASVSVSGGTTAYSYNWTPGNPTGDGTASVTGLTAGTWTCTVTDANSCTATQTFNITQPTALVASALSQTNISCNGGSNGAASVSVSGGTAAYSYNWTPGNPIGDGTASVTGLTAGTWTCTVTDANSCTTTQTFNITQPTALVASALSQTNISCNGGSNGAASVSVSGGTAAYSYNWTPGNPIGDGTASVTGLTAGTWTCTVTDANSCTTTQTFNITQPTALVASALSQTNISCNGGSNGAASVSVSSGTAPYSYNWTPGNPIGDGTASVTGLTAGTWTCTVTDANSCTTTQTFNITQPTALVASALSQTNISCNGGSNGAASVSVSSGTAPYSYNWTPGNPIGDGTASVTGLTAGTWTCTVTDANSCTTTQTFNITQPTSIVTAANTQTNVSCNGGSNGAASINTPTGGTAPYSYNWTPGNPTGDGTTSVTGLTVGTWTCTVTDANSCTTTQTFNITQPAPVVSPTASSQSFCGVATVSNLVATGTNLQWYTAATSGSPLAPSTQLVAGTYYVSQTIGSCESTRTAVSVTFSLTTWNGTSWSNGVPDSQTRVLFTGNYTASSNLSACSVAVSLSSNVLFPSNFNLTVNNEVTVASTASLTFENNANLIQINTATNTGNIIYKRNASMRRLDFTYWSSPVSSQNLLAFTPNTLNNRFYTYNEPTKLFVQVATPATTNFADARGYSLRAPNNFLDAPAPSQTFNGIYTGVPNNGNYSIPVTFTAAPTGGNGYNLIGNPYPSTVSGIAFLTANTGSVYFWAHQLLNAGVSNYATYNLSGGTAATAGGIGALPNGFIQAGQGFMFLTTTSKNVTFTNAMRQANNAGQFFRTVTTAENDKIWLNLTNNEGAFSQTMVAYLPNTTNSFDDGYDAPQINTNGTTLSSVGFFGDDFSIQARAPFVNTDVVKLKLNIDTAGNYTISKDNTNGIFSNTQDFFLKDNLLGITHNIKQAPYNFVATAGEITNRFELVYETALSNNNNLFAADSVIVFEKDNFLNISASQDLKAVKIFDVQGRNIFETNAINAKSTVLTNFRPQQQVLLVQITNANNDVVTKKVIF